MAHHLHVNPDRIDFALSEYELDSIVNLSSNNWKDFSIGLLGVGISCAINAGTLIATQTPFVVTLPIFLNTLIGSLGLTLGTIFLIVWLRTRTRASEILKSIKNRPKFELPSITTGSSTSSKAPATLP